MLKTYVIWWHSKFIDEIDMQTTRIAEIVDKTNKTLESLKKLQKLEAAGKIRVKPTGSLNPIYLEVLDSSVESEVRKNPLVEILSK
ncbi:MAG: hypothetical protein MUC80_09325 [Candidatus Thermoplasmatota archaeon]|jgi:hypothetical protein|nr:hypothetical protein [Candidatus Thermoplasmatota archaeon]